MSSAERAEPRPDHRIEASVNNDGRVADENRVDSGDRVTPNSAAAPSSSVTPDAPITPSDSKASETTTSSPENRRVVAKRNKPKPTIPSTTQLGVSGPKMVVRGFFGRCPVCGSGKLFHRWVTMVDRCPECSFLFERLEGHWIGAIAINTVAVIGLMLLLIVGTLIATYPELLPMTLVPVLLVVGALGPFVFYPASKTIWTAVDILMRPLKWGEVDPRYVIVDPLRDDSDEICWKNKS